MATSPSALIGPNSPGSSQDSGGGQGGDFSPSQMAGTDGQGQGQPPQGPSLTQATEVVRNIEQQLLSLAQQFSAVAPDVRRAIESVRNVAKRIVSQPGMQEPQAPRSGA